RAGVDVHIEETEAPGEDPFAELMPEVLPGPEVLPEREPEVLRAPLSLHRLLDRAKPSLVEAASLAALVLEALADMHDAGGTHGRLDSRSVRLTPACKVHVAGRRRTPTEAGTAHDERRADIQAAAAIVAELDKATGRPNRPLTDREEKLAARLAANADPRSLARRGLRKAARGLDLAVGRAEVRDAARQGVAGLIRAVAGYDAVAGGNGSSGGFGTANGAPLARRLPPPAPRPPLWPRIWKPLAIASVVLVVLGVEFHLFGDRVKRNVETLLGGNAQAAPGPKRPAPLPDLGPPAFGPITHLELRPLDGCRPEATCNAMVQVAVQPQSTPLDVAWTFELFDRCASLREPRPGGVLSVPAGRDRAVQTVTVALPAGRALTLVPVTTAPARVAGTPMPLYPANRPC
ncbi:MAG: hypothetical protein LC792_22545, partial [Actinobacteria bacterium]|nr:hypothetical protein [Actinomycetota bacterium]